MATLTSQQLKDSYQSLVTIGDSIVSNPTSGQLENGLGNAITALGIGTNDPQSIIHVSAPKPTYTDKGVVFRGGTTNNNSHSGISLISAGDALAGFVGSNFFVDGSTNSQSNTNRSSGYIQFTNTTATGETSDIRFGGLAKGTTTITERMRIDSSGNVGIGTTSPDTLFHLEGTDNAIIRLTNNDTSLTSNQIIGGVEFEKLDGSGAGAGVVGGMRMYSQGSVGESTYLTFSTSSSSTNNAEAMRIDSSGNVGINDTVSANFTNNYDTKLLVGGDIVARSKTSNESMVAIGGDATSAFIKAGKQDASLTARALRFEIGSSEAMRIDSDGLKFNGDTATANALDDYEEGTFTVTTASDATGAFSSESGKYVKIGKFVEIHMAFDVSTNFTSTSIGGIPFVADSSLVMSTIYGAGLARTNDASNLYVNFQMNNNGTISFENAPNTTENVYRLNFTLKTT